MMRVLVNGVGNIGTTVLNLLADYREPLGISAIYAKKTTLNAWSCAELQALTEKGIVICTDEVNHRAFRHQLPTLAIYEHIRETIDYVFETSANQVGNQNRPEYQAMPNLVGVCAQGSEKGFGTPFMSGLNNQQIYGKKFVQVVSCNTHASLSVLSCFAGLGLENLAEADFVVVRRCEDLEHHQRLVSASVVARHLDANIGTHHAIDALDLLKTIGLSPRITSSDVTTPSQLLHAFRFNLTLKAPLTLHSARSLLQAHPLISLTCKFDSNKVFEFGRRYGKYGRLYSQMIVVENNLMIQGNNVIGWAFIPQEGNTLLSTLDAYLCQTNNPSAKEVLAEISRELILKNV